MFYRLSKALWVLLFLVSNSVFAYAPEEIGFILMHGKWAAPPGPLANDLSDQGYKVVSPTMPWSHLRNYDVSYEDEVGELHKQVQELRNSGVKFVILGGHSFGANGVLAYLSKYQDVDAAMIFAPGHAPERFYHGGITKDAVDGARGLVAQGKSSDSFSFTDYNQARTKQMESTVAIYLSYYDPNGMANMPKSASTIQKSIPVLCVMSSAEQFLGKDYIFNKLPANPLGVYIESPASHMGAPEASVNDVSIFIKSIAQ